MILVLAAIIVGLLALTLTFYLQYLILNKIQAGDLMWFVWLFNIPFVVAASIIASALQQHAANTKATLTFR